jgi:hypothetical protein
VPMKSKTPAVRLWSDSGFSNLRWRFSLARRARQWQVYRKGRTAPEPKARCGDSAAMQLDEVADDGKAKPQTTMPLRRAGLPIPLEDVRKKGRINAVPGVANLKAKVAVGRNELHVHAAVLGRKLDRVGKQVTDYLLEAPRIAPYHWQIG